MSGITVGSVEVRPGRVVTWKVVGDGPPLMLLNGYAATREDWDPLFTGSSPRTFR